MRLILDNNNDKTLPYLDLGQALLRIPKRANMKKRAKSQSTPKDLSNALMTASKIRILKERCRGRKENQPPRQASIRRSHKVNK